MNKNENILGRFTGFLGLSQKETDEQPITSSYQDLHENSIVADLYEGEEDDVGPQGMRSLLLNRTRVLTAAGLAASMVLINPATAAAGENQSAYSQVGKDSAASTITLGNLPESGVQEYEQGAYGPRVAVEGPVYRTWPALINKDKRYRIKGAQKMDCQRTGVHRGAMQGDGDTWEVVCISPNGQIIPGFMDAKDGHLTKKQLPRPKNGIPSRIANPVGGS